MQLSDSLFLLFKLCKFLQKLLYHYYSNQLQAKLYINQMNDLDKKRQELTIKIRREKIRKQTNKFREKLIQSLENTQTFKFYLTQLVLHFLYKRFEEVDSTISSINHSLYFLQEDEIRLEVQQLDVPKILVYQIEKSDSKLIVSKIYEILTIMSEFQDLVDYLFPLLSKILENGKDGYFPMVAVILGNMLNYSRRRQQTLNFIINQNIEGTILMHIRGSNKHPLQQWLKLAAPYRSIIQQKGYTTNTVFFRQVQCLCVEIYLKTDKIGQINQTIQQYLCKGSNQPLENTDKSRSFIQKLSKSRNIRCSLEILRKLSALSTWINADFVHIENIISLVFNYDYNFEMFCLGLRIINNIIKNTEQEYFAEFIFDKLYETRRFPSILQDPKLFEEQIVVLIKNIVLKAQTLQTKLKILKLLPLKKLKDQHIQFFEGLLKSQIKNQQKFDLLELVESIMTSEILID